MLLRSPQNLHYPITVTELLRTAGANVDRNEPILAYNYQSTVIEGNKYGEERRVEKTFPARLEAEVEGTIKEWKVGRGSVIERAGLDIAHIEEPCTHDIQFGGLCANCGKDMTLQDYGTRVPDFTRANVNMTHGNTALRISDEEAQRVETHAKKRLLEAKKLSLVVDLDQTIIHATVDPTVGEWMDDPQNPNHEAVRDVRKFQLMDDGPCQGNWYYVKLRPGLARFLEMVSELYELHIYTMGTRAYALSIAAIVDPYKKIFGDRILSRDESGSLTAKSLQRLFPVDTKMVVIIDDRGDVWSWSHNLIKVYPYDFFKGIGDINSSFLPKQQGAALPEGPSPGSLIDQFDPQKTVSGAGAPPPQVADGPDLVETSDTESSTVEKLVSMGGNNDVLAMQEKTTAQGEQLKAQIADRPLLQEQLRLDKAEEEAAEQLAASLLAASANDSESNKQQPEAPKSRHNLLEDDDDELVHLGQSLAKVHTAFFNTHWENNRQALGGGRLSELRGARSPKKRADVDMSRVPDVQEIMSGLKTDALRGTVITFSGVIPLGILASASETGKWAMSFGANISNEVSKHTTHVIGVRNHDTAKMKLAARHPRIKIVTLYWLHQVFKEWRKVDEAPYLIDVAPGKPGKKTANGCAFGWASESDDYEAAIETALDTEDLRSPTYALPEGPMNEGDGENSYANGQAENSQSPLAEIDDDEWNDMLGEFDDEDLEDSDSEAGSESGQSVAEGGGGMNAKKRKRKTISETSSMVDGGGESDSNLGDSTSSLQRRKKRAFDRTSSLKQVLTITREQEQEQQPASRPDGTDAKTVAEDQDAAFDTLAAMLGSDADDD